jgi:hypothetical protein
MRTSLPRVSPRFFGKKPQDTTSIPAFFACEARQAPRQIHTHRVFRGSQKFIIPIEVKAGTAKHARSITQYCKKFNPEISVLASLDEMTDRILPLYAFWKFRDWIEVSMLISK